jgi:hypothetical protein
MMNRTGKEVSLKSNFTASNPIKIMKAALTNWKAMVIYRWVLGILAMAEILERTNHDISIKAKKRIPSKILTSSSGINSVLVIQIENG